MVARLMRQPRFHLIMDKASGLVDGFSYIVSLVLILKCDQVRCLVRVSPSFHQRGAESCNAEYAAAVCHDLTVITEFCSRMEHESVISALEIIKTVNRESFLIGYRIPF